MARSARARAPSLRRVPTQDRGKARVEAILDAAEVVFAEVGYDAATTEAIAAKAGASIGSLYQFFPNKRALFSGVSSRYLERVRALFDGVFPTAIPDGATWEQVLDGAVDAFWSLASGDPGFSAVWLHGRVTKELVDAGYELNRAFADRADAVMAGLAPQIPARKRKLVSIVLVEAVSGMLLSAARSEGPTGARMIEETKRMLRAYVRDVLAEHPGT